MFTSDDYKAVTKSNNVLSEAYAAVYAQDLNEEPSLGAIKSAMATKRSAENAAGMRGPELTHGAKPAPSAGAPKAAGSATSGSSVTQPRSREFSHGTRPLKNVVRGGLTMSYEPEGQMVEAFDVIAQHLYVEGYASTIEAAEVMANHISEEWAEKILEAHPNDLEAPDYKDAKRIMNQGGKQPPQKPKSGMDKLTGLPVKGV